MTISRLYLGDAFGWDTEYTAKVAISQLREDSLISRNKCPKAQLIKNESIRWQPNALKIIGYIPGLNIVAGIVAIVAPDYYSDLGPDQVARWRGRGVAMIIGGPLLIIVDLIKFLRDIYIANKYSQEHPELIKAFDTDHEHSPAYWSGHPVFCMTNGTDLAFQILE